MLPPLGPLRLRADGGRRAQAPWTWRPYLTLADGTTTIGQSRAIHRYVGSATGLYPRDDSLSAAIVDECIDGLDDLILACKAVGRPAGLPQPQMFERERAIEPGGAVYAAVERVEALYARAAHSQTYLLGQLSMADLALFAYVGHVTSGFFDGVHAGVLSDFDRVRAARSQVASHPGVLAYYEEEVRKPYYAGVAEHYAAVRGI